MNLADILLVIFIVLKLVGVIEWSWIWVLSPLWLSFVLLTLIKFIDWLEDVINNNRLL